MDGEEEVLIVDDDRETREAVSLDFSLHGLSVRQASSAVEALRCIDVRPPAALIVDMMLPSTSGLDLCRLLRRRPETAGIPILVYSGYPNPDHADTGLYDLALSKSVETGALVLAIESLLQRSEDARERAAQRASERVSPAT